MNFSHAMDGYAGTGPAATSFGYGAGWLTMICGASCLLRCSRIRRLSRVRGIWRFPLPNPKVVPWAMELHPYGTFTVTVSTQIDPSTFRIPSSG